MTWNYALQTGGMDSWHKERFQYFFVGTCQYPIQPFDKLTETQKKKRVRTTQ